MSVKPLDLIHVEKLEGEASSRRYRAILCVVTDRDPPPVVTTARYAKGQALVRCPGVDGYKSRAGRLAAALPSRYTHRERGYVMTIKNAQKLVQLYRAGWDAHTFNTDPRKRPELIQPKVQS